MSATVNMVLGIALGVIATIIIPFAVAAPRLRRDYREQRERWIREHPDADSAGGRHE